MTSVCNALAVLVVCSAVGCLYTQQQAITAGSLPQSGITAARTADDIDPIETNSAKSVNPDDDALLPSIDDAVPKLTGREALVEADRLLADGQVRLEKVQGYTATFLKQERLGKSLSDLQVIKLRLMHKPLHVFMKWESGAEAGQRIVYSPDENDGDLLIRKVTGFESRLGVIRLNPNGSLARQSSRYPVTNIGLLALTKIVRGHRQKDLQNVDAVAAELLEHGRWNGRDCSVLNLEYATATAAPDDNHEYRKCLILLDSKTHLPVWVKCYGWPDKIQGADAQRMDDTTLLEFYAYKDINFEAELRTDDFSVAKLD